MTSLTRQLGAAMGRRLQARRALARRAAAGRPPYRLVIFDFDGTLANSESWFQSVYPDLAARYGFEPLTGELIAQLRGLSTRAVFRRLRIPLWRLPSLSRQLHARAQEADPFPLFEGVPELLRTLAASGCTLAIVSSNAEAVVRRSLGPELCGLIAVFACSASLFGKARRFRAVIAATGLPRTVTLSVGDETRDVDAARTARIACASVLWGAASRTALEVAGPDFWLETPADLVPVVLDTAAGR